MRVYAIYEQSRWILAIGLAFLAARLSLDIWVSSFLYYIPESITNV